MLLHICVVYQLVITSDVPTVALKFVLERVVQHNSARGWSFIYKCRGVDRLDAADLGNKLYVTFYGSHE